jgi:hypothetical protein
VVPVELLQRFYSSLRVRNAFPKANPDNLLSTAAPGNGNVNGTASCLSGNVYQVCGLAPIICQLVAIVSLVFLGPSLVLILTFPEKLRYHTCTARSVVACILLRPVALLLACSLRQRHKGTANFAMSFVALCPCRLPLLRTCLYRCEVTLDVGTLEVFGALQ